jgi:hypothetical protein
MHFSFYQSGIIPFLSIIIAFFVGSKPNFAQTATPAAAEKYIFYWGELQANLIVEEKYSAEIRTTYNTFRKTIFSTPSMWNGKALSRQLQFTVGDIAVKTTNAADSYSAFIVDLDQKLGRSLKNGDTVRVTNIVLDGGVVGQFNIILEEAKKQPNQPPNWNNFTASYSENLNIIQSLEWGKWLNTQNNSEMKEYYTVAEFEETIKLLPNIKFNNDSLGQDMVLFVYFRQEQNDLNSIKVSLKPDQYHPQMKKFMLPYQHLIQPGMSVMFEFAERTPSNTEIRWMLNIVAGDDPRLLLKLPRDAHNLQIEWGQFRGNYVKYLKGFPDANGKMRYADRPSTMRLTQQVVNSGPFAEEDNFSRRKNLETMINTRPVLRVDNKEIWPYSFTIHYAGTDYAVGETELLPNELKESLLEGKNSADQRNVMRSVTVKNIKSKSGYEFEPLEFHLFIPVY